MFKLKHHGLLLVIVSSVVLSGCVAPQTSSTKDGLAKKYSNEQLLVSSGNHEELIKLYKQQLLQQDSAETRAKLVRSYIEIKDFESALFYIQPLMESESVSADAYFLYGKAQFGLSDYPQAESALNKSVQLDANHGEALNLLGVLAAYNGEYNLARQRFVQARQKMVDDVKIKNNLAMVDLIDGHYQAAVEKLTPLLSQANPSEKVKSNLAFAYAKLGMFDQFEQLVANSRMTKADAKAVFEQLAQIELKVMEGPPEFLAGENIQLD